MSSMVTLAVVTKYSMVVGGLRDQKVHLICKNYRIKRQLTFKHDPHHNMVLYFWKGGESGEVTSCPWGCRRRRRCRRVAEKEAWFGTSRCQMGLTAWTSRQQSNCQVSSQQHCHNDFLVVCLLEVPISYSNNSSDPHIIGVGVMVDFEGNNLIFFL